MLIEAHSLTEGRAQGELALLREPLSLWGGLDVSTGTIIDVTHPQCGLVLAGRVLAMKTARGSSSASSALLEAARAGVAPAAIILQQHDAILVIGALVAAELYGVLIPVVTVSPADWPKLVDGEKLEVNAQENQASIRGINRA